VPLRFATIMGVIVSLTSFIYNVYYIKGVFVGRTCARISVKAKKTTYIARDYNGEKIYK